MQAIRAIRATQAVREYRVMQAIRAELEQEGMGGMVVLPT
jgi:hypothetical protein